MKKKKVVIFGGANGTGLSVRGLKKHADVLDITAVVSMSDSGRSSGKVRDELGELPPADVLRVIIAGSSYEYYLLKEIFYTKRFTTDKKIAGLNIGTLLIALGAKYTGDIVPIIQDLSEMLECQVQVLPATLTLTELHARLDDGRELHSEGDIDCPQEDCGEHLIEKVWLDPTGPMYSGAVQAVKDADVIITGPGDLYSSNIASILAEGTMQAIEQSHAKLVYIAGNKYSINGEPAPRSLSERVSALEKYLPRPVDVVLYNTHELGHVEKEKYAARNWGLLDFDVHNITDRRVIGVEIERKGGGIDPDKLGNALMQIM
ncbi:MAG: YvcK family protein [Candidatus Magasanikbacteria bacterium]|jgi:uncharacterized cofD-like protein|nr:YvcK family protein [Candidatus Magasanikbacteria bacterium]